MKHTKDVLGPGKYLVKTATGRQWETITPDRIKHWISQFKKMAQAGLKIPAIWDHNREAVPITAGASVKDGIGFVEDLQEKDGKLFLATDIPLEEDSKRVGTVVKEVSPFIMRSFTDGLGRKWDDVIAHMGFVHHAVVPDQDNFEPVIGFSLFASDLVESYSGDIQMAEHPTTPIKPAAPNEPSQDMPAKTASFADALNALREMGLDLPDDTNETNFSERILVAVRAIKGKKDTEPEAPVSSEAPTPVALSTNEMTDRERLYFSMASDAAAQGYKNRINQLVARKTITRDHADKHLIPQLGGFQLSLSDSGEPIKGSLDAVLEALEALPAGQHLANEGPRTAGYMMGYEVPVPDGLDNCIEDDPEKVDEIVQAQFKTAGRTDLART